MIIIGTPLLVSLVGLLMYVLAADLMYVLE